jgi:hypothetical protein
MPENAVPSPWKPIVLSTAGVLLLTGALVLLSPSTAEAQCGSQASSCKNCHEVQGQLSVNAVGDWHVSHAFGDFCEFCHAGNVQATNAELAHQAMVEPLADPASSCSACHPDNARDLAIVYGGALGVDVGAGANQPPASAPAEAATPTSEAGPAADSSSAVAPDLIDYDSLYAETVEGGEPISTGNLILGILIAVLVLGGGGYVVWNERKRRLKASPRVESGEPAPDAAVSTPAATVLAAHRPGVLPGSPLLQAISALDPLGRRALEKLLRDPQAASDLLQRLSRLDPEMLRGLRGLDRETRALLLALTSD